jgi:hypothetical protein
MDRDWCWHPGVRDWIGGYATSGSSPGLPQRRSAAAPAACGTGPSDTAMPGRLTDTGWGLLPGTASSRAAIRGRAGLTGKHALRPTLVPLLAIYAPFQVFAFHPLRTLATRRSCRHMAGNGHRFPHSSCNQRCPSCGGRTAARSLRSVTAHRSEARKLCGRGERSPRQVCSAWGCAALGAQPSRRSCRMRRTTASAHTRCVRDEAALRRASRPRLWSG